MKYKNIHEAIFLNRPNRFVAEVKLKDEIVTVHVKNTGRCKELLTEGTKVILSQSDNPSRKYKYDLVTVWKDSVGWVNIDSQAPNIVVKEYLKANRLFDNLTLIKPETTYGDSRIDFYLEREKAGGNENSTDEAKEKIFIEVKGCTLEIDGEGYFPDAPTERGVKHLRELIKAQKEGYSCYIAFVIQMEKINRVYPYIVTHPEFGVAMEEAKTSGVKTIFFTCDVTKEELKINDAIID